MARKTFVNQKLGKRTTHRQQIGQLKTQFDRRTLKQKGRATPAKPK